MDWLFLSIQIATFAVLFTAIVGHWFFPNAIKWSLLALSLIGAFYVKDIGVFGLAFLLLASLMLAGYYDEIPLGKRFSKKSLFAVLFILGFLMLHHMLPGFNAWKVVKNVKLSKESKSFDLRYYFESGAFAFLLIGIGAMATRTREAWTHLLKKFPIDILITAIILFPTAYFLHGIVLDIKISAIFPLWMIKNLFLVSLPEECFFRGFLQKELALYLGNRRFGQLTAIVITSIVFGLFHFQGGANYMLLTAIAGLLFGWVYNRRKTIESAVLVHFTVNLIHLFFFRFHH